MSAGGCPRPGVDQEINIVILGRPEVGLISGRVLFERGRGIIVETREKADDDLARGLSSIVVYAARSGVYSFRAKLGEVISDSRLYLLPTTEPRQMEKREYIRAIMTMPAALVDDLPNEDTSLEDVKLELSASGFRWFHSAAVSKDDKVWLRLGLEDEDGPLDLPAKVVRVDTLESGSEVAGQFLVVDQHQQDALLRVVFRTRLNELGLQGDL